jgi:hypothetical protein
VTWRRQRDATAASPSALLLQQRVPGLGEPMLAAGGVCGTGGWQT